MKFDAVDVMEHQPGLKACDGTVVVEVAGDECMPLLRPFQIASLQERDSVQVEDCVHLVDGPCPFPPVRDVAVNQTSERSLLACWDWNQTPVRGVCVPDVSGDLDAVLLVRLAGGLEDDVQLAGVQHEHFGFRVLHQVPCQKRGRGTSLHSYIVPLSETPCETQTTLVVHPFVEDVRLLETCLLVQEARLQRLLGEVKAEDPSGLESAWSVHGPDLHPMESASEDSLQKVRSTSPSLLLSG